MIFENVICDRCNNKIFTVEVHKGTYELIVDLKCSKCNGEQRYSYVE